MRRFLLVFLLLIAAGTAQAQQPPGAFKHVVSTPDVRPANTSNYSGSASSPQIVCQFASVTPCAPITLRMSSFAVTNGYGTNVRLTKNATNATSATFQVLLYQSSPTIAATIFDGSVYQPSYADQLSGAFLGYWTCSTAVTNGDNLSYECTATSNSGDLAFSMTTGTVYALITTTGAYQPASTENFIVTFDALVSAQ